MNTTEVTKLPSIQSMLEGVTLAGNILIIYNIYYDSNYYYY